MNEQDENGQNIENEVSDSSVKFSGPAVYAPGLILEQCMHIRALLRISLRVQMETLAHLTSDDPQATFDRFAVELRESALDIAREARASMDAQPPLE